MKKILVVLVAAIVLGSMLVYAADLGRMGGHRGMAGFFPPDSVLTLTPGAMETKTAIIATVVANMPTPDQTKIAAMQTAIANLPTPTT